MADEKKIKRSGEKIECHKKAKQKNMQKTGKEKGGQKLLIAKNLDRT